MSQSSWAPRGRCSSGLRVRGHQKSVQRHAFTLVEMLVALVITLILMGAATTIFGIVANSVSESRSVMEASDRLRLCPRLQLDLSGITASMRPPLRPEAGEVTSSTARGQRATTSRFSRSRWLRLCPKV